jgi:hypothetical protein
MAIQTIERPVQRPAADLEALFPGRYLSVTSFKRDGTGVATPVQPVADAPPAVRPFTGPRPDDHSHTPPHGDPLLAP